MSVGNSVRRVSRYPGVRPFGDDELQRQLFRGREEEEYELLQLVLAERLVLLSALSGVGKSSLVNAGLLEPLRERGFFPMVVRLSGPAETPVECLYDGIKAALSAASTGEPVEHEPCESEWRQASLGLFFETLELWQGDRPLTPVLIIDQFEELFTLYAPEQRERLVDELAHLVRGSRPLRALGNDAKPGDGSPEVKVVLCLREDFYISLEDLRDRIPSLYVAPFRLRPLSRQQAERAIVEPAALESEHFWTSPFVWSHEAVATVLDILSEQQLGEGSTAVGREVEPFQLQLICHHVEEKASKEGLRTIGGDALGGGDTLKEILSSFYEGTIKTVCGKFSDDASLRPRLERLCEYGLITARGRRLLREESTIKHDDGIDPEVLQELVELRLLRKQPRVGDNYYELVHDSLIGPIQLSRQARERQKALETREARIKSRKQLIAAAAFASLVLLATGTWALWERAEMRRVAAAKEEARAALLEAEAQAQRSALTAARALAAEQDALAAKQASLQFAVEAKLEAGEQGARRALAEAEAELAEVKPLVDAAQKKLAAAKVQSAQAAGQDYEQDARRLAAAAEAELREATRELGKVRQAVLEAKTKLTLVEAMRDESKTGQAETELEMNAEGGRVEKERVGSVKRSVESEDRTGALERRLTGAALPLVEDLPLATDRRAGAEAERGANAQLKLDVAALEFLETEPGITDGELARRYRAFSSARGKELDAEETQRIEAKTAELEQAARTFTELQRRDGDPDFSVCEAFDQWTAYRPRRALSPESRYRDLRLAELDADVQDSVVVTTQDNFITSGGEDDSVLKQSFIYRKDRVYIHAWVNAPEHETVRLVLRRGESEQVIWQGKQVERNPLRGVHVGYHLWTWKGAKAIGQHELRLYDAEDTLLCRREFQVVAQSP